jgi:hypothetical protein
MCPKLAYPPSSFEVQQANVSIEIDLDSPLPDNPWQLTRNDRPCPHKRRWCGVPYEGGLADVGARNRFSKYSRGQWRMSASGPRGCAKDRRIRSLCPATYSLGLCFVLALLSYPRALHRLVVLSRTPSMRWPNCDS